jgi:hypothetical protein
MTSSPFECGNVTCRPNLRLFRLDRVAFFEGDMRTHGATGGGDDICLNILKSMPDWAALDFWGAI